MDPAVLLNTLRGQIIETLHQKWDPGDAVYLFSDGYANPFGGPDGKKFKYREFKKLIVSISDNSMNLQGAELDTSFERWKGDLNQLDDVVVTGLKF